jgi:hypothetical protein
MITSRINQLILVAAMGAMWEGAVNAEVLESREATATVVWSEGSLGRASQAFLSTPQLSRHVRQPSATAIRHRELDMGKFTRRSFILILATKSLSLFVLPVPSKATLRKYRKRVLR